MILERLARQKRRRRRAATNEDARHERTCDQARGRWISQKILKLLPHRYPFLMVDRIIDIRGDEFAIGIKNVTVNEPHFRVISRAIRCFPAC